MGSNNPSPIAGAEWGNDRVIPRPYGIIAIDTERFRFIRKDFRIWE